MGGGGRTCSSTHGSRTTFRSRCSASSGSKDQAHVVRLGNRLFHPLNHLLSPKIIWFWFRFCLFWEEDTEVNSQHPHSASQPALTPLPGMWLPLLAATGTAWCRVFACTQANYSYSYTNKCFVYLERGCSADVWPWVCCQTGFAYNSSYLGDLNVKCNLGT